MKNLLLLSLFFWVSSTVGAETMSQVEMENIVKGHVEVISQKKGYIVFMYKKVKMALISDVEHDRMRIISPITKYPALTMENKDAVMESNFHSALDARYGVSNGVLFSAYIHPMSPLTKQQLEGALDQVSTLARTFGSTYTSGSLTFDGKSKKVKPKPKKLGV